MMSKHTKLWLILGTVFTVSGLLLFAFAMTVHGWDFTKLNRTEYETNTHSVEEAFQNVEIETNTADIQLLPSEDGMCTVVCREEAKEKHTVSVDAGTLSIRIEDKREWYDYISLGIDFESPSVTVYLPEAEYGALQIRGDTSDIEIPTDFSFTEIQIEVSTGDIDCSASASDRVAITTTTGDIDLKGVTADTVALSVSTGGVTVSDVNCTGTMTLAVSTGDATFSDVTCGSFASSGDTGDITLKSLVAEGKITVTRSTGDVRFDASDGAEISVETSTGKVSGTLLSEKIFFASSDTGRVDVPKTVTGGKCEISTDTGNIHISFLTD